MNTSHFKVIRRFRDVDSTANQWYIGTKIETKAGDTGGNGN